MTLVTPAQVSPDDEVSDASVNTPINQIAAVVNGQLDDSNIRSISGSKLSDGTITTAKLGDGAVTPAKTDFAPETNGVWSVLEFGGLKIIWTETASRSTGTSSGTVTTTIPNGLLSSVLTAQATASSLTGEARVVASITSLSTTSVTVNLNTTAGSGTAKAQVLIIGT